MQGRSPAMVCLLNPHDNNGQGGGGHNWYESSLNVHCFFVKMFYSSFIAGQHTAASSLVLGACEKNANLFDFSKFNALQGIRKQ